MKGKRKECEQGEKGGKSIRGRITTKSCTYPPNLYGTYLEEKERKNGKGKGGGGIYFFGKIYNP